MRERCLSGIYELAKNDPRVLFIGSNLGQGTLDEFRRDMPERYFMEGITEQHIIGMAAGMAMDGFIPYVNTIATFLTRRCYEQIAIDVCLHNLPVRLVGSGGGLVYAPLGPTHQATEDIAILRSLPNMTVIVPADAEEMQRLMPQTAAWSGPIYIRLAKGKDPIVSSDLLEYRIGKAVVLREPGSVLFIANGIMVQRALLAADLLADERISCGVINLHTVKPMDVKTLVAQAKKADVVITLEEHTTMGGMGSAVTEALVDNMNGYLPVIKRLGLPDSYISEYGSQKSALASCGLEPHDIASLAVKTLRNSIN
ncbi:MAG: transketolase [Gammaproteobacteria bacterium SG8_11]|nr:MAG: transketolase [Gammaproteobacteria bacterium SG8_11]